LHGLQGLQGFFAAQGLQALALQGLQLASCTPWARALAAGNATEVF
jgi:hypothetical protein